MGGSVKRMYTTHFIYPMARPVRASDYALVERFLEDPNTMRLRQTDVISFHVAMLMRRGKILAVASNRLGSRSQGCGFSNFTIHAERNVIKEFGDISQLKGCDLYVMRIHQNRMTGKKYFGNSAPCRDCQIFLEKCQRRYGLRHIYYTKKEKEGED
jgi:hypothetical protein